MNTPCKIMLCANLFTLQAGVNKIQKKGRLSPLKQPSKPKQNLTKNEKNYLCFLILKNLIIRTYY